MPELPEVETIRIGLGTLLPGRTIASETHDWPKGFPNAKADVANFLIGATITTVRRRAKVLIIDLNTTYSLIIHLKMTGQLVFRSGTDRFGAGHPNDSLVGELPDKSTRVILTFEGGSQLFFNDQRKFGWMRLLPTSELTNLDFFKTVGPEPLADNFTANDFIACIRRRQRSMIKPVLLDQTIVAGIGNIYADESLWGAKTHPETRVHALTDQALRRLYTELQAVLRLSIEKGGSTDRNYVSTEGKRGSYLSFARAFRREGQPCPRCGTTIVKLRVAGRGTHICPHCQKLPK
ncbi:MAG TPA: bifunctional DNA-formamidopyrimidine glycosylase/DNA-(apurinic or apyrimidinic site) lyase [Candidatus Saccharimonadales bacterium]|nr:bifunctional DNA-formamidopyrimidine glycosylase/DNA-(apurinic or apyrimidinic site) lyase [Candidatus Saccharimonadales bacterium]